MKVKKFNTEPKNLILRIMRFTTSLRGWWHRKSFEAIETIVLFIGYGRSGHTLIGSILDAHPDTSIAHELDILYYFKHRYWPWQIYFLILKNSAQFTKRGRGWMGYNYTVPKQWQGRCRRLKVIGDKSGARSTRRIEEFQDFSILEKVIACTGKKLVMIHVIRNPFDNISTMLTRSSKRRNLPIFTELLYILSSNNWNYKLLRF